jgi:hypothetical protein
MKLWDENVLAEVSDDIEAPGELAEEDTNFLKRLEKMVKKVEDDPDSID